MHQRNKQNKSKQLQPVLENKQMRQIHQETNKQLEQTNEQEQIKAYELKSRHLVLKFKNQVHQVHQVHLPLAVTTMIQSASESFNVYGKSA